MTRQQERIEDDADERMTGSEAKRWWQRQQEENTPPESKTKKRDKCSS
jgi:hypothetical protein